NRREYRLANRPRHLRLSRYAWKPPALATSKPEPAPNRPTSTAEVTEPYCAPLELCPPPTPGWFRFAFETAVRTEAPAQSSGCAVRSAPRRATGRLRRAVRV